MKWQEMSQFGIDIDEIEYYLERLRNEERAIVVTGEFSSGKSSFINALLGKEGLLAEGISECTPMVVELYKGEENSIVVKFDDGQVCTKQYDEIEINRLTNLTNKKTNILSISIPIKTEYLLENVVMIDTPGTNTLHSIHEEITEGVIKKSDIVFYVINKTISATDITSINRILEYTSEIIFILTHMDEFKDGHYKMLGNALIQKFKSEVAKEIVANTKLSDALIYPLSTKLSEKDSLYFKEIREDILLNLKDIYPNVELKNTIVRQLNIFMQSHLQKLEQEQSIYINAQRQEKEAVSKEVAKIQRNITKVRAKHDSKNMFFKEKVADYKKVFNKKIDRVIEKYINEVTDNLAVSQEVTPEKISTLMKIAYNDIARELGMDIVKRLEQLNNNLYEDINFDTSNLPTPVIDFSCNIEPPMLEDLTYIKDEIYRQIAIKEQQLHREIVDINEEIALTYEQDENTKLKLFRLEQNLEDEKHERQTMGRYIPQYDEVITQGGGTGGASFGRILGEVADAVLIFYNPIGASASAGNVAARGLKTLDTVKDITKITQYATQVATKTTKLFSSEKASALNKVLDIVSLGNWGEKMGHSIGEMISPTQLTLVENQKVRMDYEQQLSIHNQEIQIRYNNLSKLEEELEANNISRIQFNRDKKRLEQQLLELQQEAFIKEQEVERITQLEHRVKTKQYYTEQISENLLAYKQVLSGVLNIIFEEGMKEILVASEIKLKSELKSVEENLELLLEDDEGIAIKIKAIDDKLSTLQNYDQWIEGWVL
ncbi:MAG: hypothetical protein ATN36_07085 [Epulopiscium sp. Nele67-Bin005]|nr:MAG: hypothetical protein ATN36_07085 [Epulopiscium sp. Nele67-Bin005]